MKTIMVCGGAGFIGHHLARKLKSEGHKVIVVDIKDRNEYCESDTFCDDYHKLDLSKQTSWYYLDFAYSNKVDEIYQLAADMGGAGYIFTGENDFNVMRNSGLINLHCAEFAIKWKAKVFYSSSACMYPSHNQEDPDNPLCSEDSAYPANPDSEYGWEKLFSERLFLSAFRNFGLDVRIARFHNIFGPEGIYDGGKEKAPAALCRKVAKSEGSIDVWGPGTQTRSFLYIDECIEAMQRLMASDFKDPVNIGSEEMISINDLGKMIIDISGKECIIDNVEGPLGVMGRNSDNRLIQQKLGWAPSMPLRDGIKKTYEWINNELQHISRSVQANS
tara:strand:- start:462 stop:1457 length:996 start_codon:yes stop_codon:yes gene_type:complete